MSDPLFTINDTFSEPKRFTKLSQKDKKKMLARTTNGATNGKESSQSGSLKLETLKSETLKSETQPLIKNASIYVTEGSASCLRN